jgi:hypothetical protein
MRRNTAILSVAAIVLMAAGPIAQAKPRFAGEWKKVAATGQGEPGVDLIITQDEKAMTVEYKREGQPPAPVKLTYTLDGSASKNLTTGQGGGKPTEQVSKAVWAGDDIVVTTTTGSGAEKRTFSLEAGDLVVETSARQRDGKAPTVTKVTYKRYQRGHGG